MTTDNPLSKFFRQPAIYLKLPSNGASWPANTLEMPVTGELPVLPMTAIDEITYRTPDALFNGEAVVSVIKSCIPSIKDPWQTPTVDLDAILVAIRIASYGHKIDIDSSCPGCKEEHSFELDLRGILDNLSTVDYSEPFNVNDLVFYFRPLTYKEITDNGLEQFEYQKTLQALNESESISNEEKIARVNSMMKNLIVVTVKAMSQSIIEIRANGAVVNKKEHIEEFLENCNSTVFNKLKAHIIKMREKNEIKPISITCPACSHKYEQNFTLDMSNFFGSAS